MQTENNMQPISYDILLEENVKMKALLRELYEMYIVNIDPDSDDASKASIQEMDDLWERVAKNIKFVQKF